MGEGKEGKGLLDKGDAQIYAELPITRSLTILIKNDGFCAVRVTHAHVICPVMLLGPACILRVPLRRLITLLNASISVSVSVSIEFRALHLAFPLYWRQCWCIRLVSLSAMALDKRQSSDAYMMYEFKVGAQG
jgi:hypothetical protein